MKLIVHTDASVAWGVRNPPTVENGLVICDKIVANAIGIVIADDNGVILKEVAESIPDCNNSNKAEVVAISRALGLCVEFLPESITIFSDSAKFAYSLLNENEKSAARVRTKGFIKDLRKQFPNLTCPIDIVWIPRARNARANKLARQITKHIRHKVSKQIADLHKELEEKGIYRPLAQRPVKYA